MAQITLRDYLQETEDAIRSKRIDEALASCQYILAYFPEFLEAQRLLGEVYLAQGRLEDARNAFDWVLTNDPENVVAYCSRAQVSEHTSDYDTALDCYQQAYELSRGNSHIRQAFNQLSARAGQQGFMFSRAGLARLYMRGDLLAQAVQEWDIVLAIMPDRLDARTGLLEAYWRQGLYDRVSQLAEQILQDVPGCVKALLMLAHVMAPQDMLRSRDLIQRVCSLDPDLQMAHELFADHKKSLPGDPFLKLLDRPAATLGEPDRAAASVASSNGHLQLSGSNSSDSGTPSISDQLANWGGAENWNNESTLLKPRSDTPEQTPSAPSLPAAQADPAMPSWMSDDAFGRGFYASPDALSAPSEGSNAGLRPDASQSGSPSEAQWGNAVWNANTENQLPEGAPIPSEPWQSLQNVLNDISPEAARQMSDHGLDASPFSSPLQPPTPSDGSGSNWDLPGSLRQREAQQKSEPPISQEPASLPDSSNAINSSSSWSLAPQEAAKAPAPPAWLSMLTQAEPVQPVAPVSPFPDPATQYQPPVPTQVEPVQQIPVPTQAEPVQQIPVPTQAEPAQAESVATQDDDEDEMPDWARMMQSDDADGEEPDEDSFFGPAWLRSLGAMDEPGAEQPVSPPALEQPSAVSTPDITDSVEPVQPEPERPQQPEVPAQAEPVRQWQLAQEPQQPAANPSWMDWQSALESPPAAAINNSWWQESSEQYDPFAGTGQRQESQPVKEQSNSWLSNSGADAFSFAPQQQNEESQPIQSQPYSQPPFEPELQLPAAASMPDQPDPVTDDPWAKLSQQLQDKSIDYAWLEQLANGQQSSAPAEAPVPAVPVEPVSEESQHVQQEHSEQHVIATLEELDQRLRSRGFITLEPNSLASIAQSSESSAADHPMEEMIAAETDPQPEREEPAIEPYAEPSLYSAFAELSEAFKPQQATEQQAEPAWFAALQSEQHAQPELPAANVQNPVPVMPSPAVPVPPTPSQQSSFVSGPTGTIPFEPAPVPYEVSQPAPVARPNPLLDSELETTMKRPAVRLQPVKQRILAQELRPAPVTHPEYGQSRQGQQGQPGQQFNHEQAGYSTIDGNVSYRERLVHGYQAQLVGDYDNAMQEYRIIIRNAPELLSEVVSNVRALLKLAPKYSAGYRVLGDAYMRQGEYLQAMEAYNKALTMAKKARN
ncbi:tetratricopeptide repeat protein [Ktedonobacteria bacterium brp13]|nr:tetratricopeptide repeat protein [Ktedonobacteria bacterium brp13]